MLYNMLRNKLSTARRRRVVGRHAATEPRYCMIIVTFTLKLILSPLIFLHNINIQYFLLINDFYAIFKLILRLVIILNSFIISVITM